VIEERIRHFIIKTFLYGNGDTLVNNTSLSEAGIIDSTGILELISFLEKEFSITFEDDELIPENLDSIECLSQFINLKLKNS